MIDLNFILLDIEVLDRVGAKIGRPKYERIGAMGGDQGVIGSTDQHHRTLASDEGLISKKVAGGQFQMRHAPQDRIARRELAQDVVDAAQGFEGALAVRVEDKRQGPPKLHDLPSLQKLCGSRFGWSASRTLEVAQELYDGQGKKIITYPRAEVRYLPQSLISDVPRIVTGLQAGQSFSAIPVPVPPVIRRGASTSALRARHYLSAAAGNRAPASAAQPSGAVCTRLRRCRICTLARPLLLLAVSAAH
jgi:DNA topoisomerase